MELAEKEKLPEVEIALDADGQTASFLDSQL